MTLPVYFAGLLGGLDALALALPDAGARQPGQLADAIFELLAQGIRVLLRAEAR
jgi:hypothetical protein